MKRLFVCLAAAVCLAGANTASQAHDLAEAHCIPSSFLGVAGGHTVCGSTDLGNEYLRCLQATPVFGLPACGIKYDAQWGRDFHFHQG